MYKYIYIYIYIYIYNKYKYIYIYIYNKFINKRFTNPFSLTTFHNKLISGPLRQKKD